MTRVPSRIKPHLDGKFCQTEMRWQVSAREYSAGSDGLRSYKLAPGPARLARNTDRRDCTTPPGHQFPCPPAIFVSVDSLSIDRLRIAYRTVYWTLHQKVLPKVEPEVAKGVRYPH